MSAIYLHIPFCKQACHYCDFHFSTQRKNQAALVEALGKELLMRRGELGDAAVETIYFGGGTPSLLNQEQLNYLLQVIHQEYPVVKEPEITLEANPDDLTEEVLENLRNAGINRLSIGLQSFSDRDLKLMNRAHTAAEAEKSLKLASSYFSNLSADLIYAIPYQTLQEWEEHLGRVVSFAIPHLSCYALTVEPGTALKRFIDHKQLPPVDEDRAEAQFRLMTSFLTSRGYVHYEVSNFGKPGFFSKNNTAYWLGKPYLGIGPSAHSYDGAKRSWNISNNPQYLRAIREGVLPSSEEQLTLTDRYNEYVMTGLRTQWGISPETVKDRFGFRYYEYLLQQSRPHLDGQRLELQDGSLKVAEHARFLSDGIASDLFMLNTNQD